MKSQHLFLALALTAPLAANAGEIPVRRVAQTFPAGDFKEARLDIPVGELEVVAGDGSQVSVDVEFRCGREGRCREAAKDVRVLVTSTGDQFKLRMTDWPKLSGRGLSVRVKVAVPASLPVNADLGVGELRVEGLEGNLMADIGVGEASVDLPAAAVGSVDLDVGIGDATLRADGKRRSSSGVGAKAIHWSDGKGQSRVNVDCGVGEAAVTLH